MGDIAPGSAAAPNVLVRSPYVGRLVLRDGRTVFCHVLGKVRLVCRGIVATVLDAFESPRTATDFFRQFANGVDGEPIESLEAILGELRSADLLQPASSREVERIRHLFALRFDPAPRLERLPLARLPGTGWPPKDETQVRGTVDATDLSGASTLVLSEALTTLEVAKGEHLVTHPLERRLHLGEEILHLAERFRQPALVSHVARESGLPIDRVLEACRFLVRKRILWPSREAELDDSESRVRSGNDRLVERMDSGCEQWEQRFVAYHLSDLVPVRRTARVAAIGTCQVHASTPALQLLGSRRAWDIEVRSWVTPSVADLRSFRPTVVILSLATSLVDLYEAIALKDYARCRALTPEIGVHFDHALEDIRRKTQAPVLVHSAGLPGLAGYQPSSPATHHLNVVLAELNAELLARTGGHERVYLLDQNRVVAENAIGIHWDDEHNALRHHSCVSMWGRPPRDLGWSSDLPTAPGVGDVSAVPPIPPGQVDPAVAFALAHLDFVERVCERAPVRMIVFEPNDLLWPGSLESRSSPYDEDFNFYTGDSVSKYLGIHEALRILGTRGIELACLSSSSPARLRDRWRIASRLPTLLHLEQLQYLEGGPRPKDSLLRILKKAAVPAEQTLLLNLPHAAIPELFSGRVVSGAPWELRRYLLTAPELDPLENELRQGVDPRRSRRVRPLERARVRASGHCEPVKATEVRADLAGLLCERLRCDAAALLTSTDLRSLGLDSLGSLEIVSRIESRFEIDIPDADRTAAVVFSWKGLSEATMRALRSKELVDRSTRGSRRPVTRDEWCAQDIPSVLARHIGAPRVPWILKVLRSTAPMDYRYVTWTELAEQAVGYLALFRCQGLREGDLVTIVMPQGLPLIAAIVGAFLGRMLPAVSAFPSEKLSESAFAQWFAKLVVDSDARLVVCEPRLRRTIVKELSGMRLDIPVCSTIPAPQPFEPPGHRPPRPDASGVVQYSSGTTGVKKAVVLTHRAVLSQVWDLASLLGCGPNDVIVSWLPLYHDMGYVAGLLLPLLHGIPTVQISPFDWIKQPHVLFEQISEEGGTISWLPNFAFLHSALRIRDTVLAGIDLSTLRAAINCSEPVTAQAMDQFYEKFSPYGLRRAALSSSYAMAETTFAVTQSKIGVAAQRARIVRSKLAAERLAVRAPHDWDSADVIELVSSGEILPATRVQIVGRGNVLPEGHVGEIRIRTQSLMKGYFKAPKATRAAVRDGWYHSGDLGFLLDGELYVTGREKDVLIITGRNIYPHEVEQRVSEVPGIKPGRVVLFGIFDHDAGTERGVLLAETNPRHQAPRRVEVVKVAIRNLVLAEFGVTLSDIELFAGQVLLKSTSGKLSRARNREEYLARRGRPVGDATSDVSETFSSQEMPSGAGPQR